MVYSIPFLFLFIPSASASSSSLNTSLLNNSTTRTTPGATRSASVWVRADKGDKSSPVGKTFQSKVSNKKFYKRESQISTASSSDSLDSSNRNSLENPIELHEKACIVILFICSVLLLCFRLTGNLNTLAELFKTNDVVS